MPRITEMFAFIAEESGPDDEGVIGTVLPNGMMMPLVGADMDRVASLIPLARAIAKKTNTKVKLVTFSVRTDVEEILPEGSN